MNSIFNMDRSVVTQLQTVLPKEYGYVILSGGVGTFLVNMYLGKRVVNARKEYNVKYPAVYSADNDKFNCVQRAHQNYLEALPLFLTTSFIAGTVHPLKVTAFNTIYLIGRIVFAHGYYTGDPEKRRRGGFMYLGFFGNLLLTIHVGLSMAGLV